MRYLYIDPKSIKKTFYEQYKVFNPGSEISFINIDLQTNDQWHKFHLAACSNWFARVSASTFVLETSSRMREQARNFDRQMSDSTVSWSFSSQSLINYLINFSQIILTGAIT